MLQEEQLREAIERYKNRPDGVYKKWSDEANRKLFLARVREAVEETISVIEQGKFQREAQYNPLQKIATAYYDWDCLTPERSVMWNLLSQSNIYSSPEGQKVFNECLKVFLKNSRFEELCETVKALDNMRSKLKIKNFGASALSHIFYGLCPEKFALINNSLSNSFSYYYSEEYARIEKEYGKPWKDLLSTIGVSKFTMAEKKKVKDLLPSDDFGDFLGMLFEARKESISLRWNKTTPIYSIGDKVEARGWMRWGDEEWCSGIIKKKENELYYVWYDDFDNEDWDEPWHCLDAADIRPLGVQVSPHPKVDTMNVPTPIPEPPEDEVVSDHLKIQWMLAKIGLLRKKKVWIAKNDQSKSYNGESFSSLTINELPLHGFKDEEKGPIERIDVIWLDGEGNNITDMFEIELTTAINSGLLRMSDLLSRQRSLLHDCTVNIVAPSERKEKVESEMDRPAFDHLKKARHYKFYSFDAIVMNYDCEKKITIER